VPLDTRGTSFLLAVWQALRNIPFGQTVRYRDIAAAVGRPGAAHAIGGAVGKNPVAIIVPCHRVIGADGSLTGYTGGLERKKWLLEHEQRALAATG
jgi:O-6-methylguanine DNA methyltransferase